MHIIIYRKSNGQPLLQETISSFFTVEKEKYDTTYNYERVVKNHGGTKEDYTEAWLEDDEIVKKTITHEFTVVNGEIIFGNEKVFEELPKEPSVDDYLLDLDYRLSTVELGL
ncbi:hypothetical protein [Cytobacillus sp.]|uniref:hypothetical protein n=1 Tax=Cytobacillus sp. TaxID=2675269 RepID=UPI0028BE9C1C|nr:hypothetical protein [Cytobacillus sp.]